MTTPSPKYRIKSLDLLEEKIFVIEEIGVSGEFRLSIEVLLANTPLLYQFDQRDIRRILYTATLSL